MKCRDYVFLFSSGQLAEADRPTRARARLHRWGCTACRRFSRNDEQLSRLLAQWRRRVPPAG